MSLTAISLLESARRKFFRIKRFWAQEAEMSLTAISSLESARRKFFMNLLEREKKIFHKLDVSCLESRNQTFLGSGGRNESNSYQLAGIGEKKIFHKLDVHHVQKVGYKRFWAQEAEMSLTDISSLQSARRKVFHQLDVHHVQKVGIKRFWAQEAEMSLTAISSLESALRKLFHELDVHHVQKVGIKRFWAQETEMS